MFAMGRLGKLGVVARAVQGAFAPFNPASLFANGEQGVWYDISDFDRYMSELGPNSVVNGGFDNGLTGWTAKADVIVEGGRAKCFATNASYRAILRQTQPFNGAGWYRIRGNVQNVSMQIFCQLQAMYEADSSFIASSHPNAHPIGVVSAADFSFYADAPFYVNFLIDVGVNDPSRIAYVDNIRCEKLTAISTATLFQDAAGTIPVTAVEQPVGLILDKSGRGNHASQATTTARGVLRARYNLLTYSEDFSNPAWVKYGGINVIGTKKLVPTTASRIHKTTNTQASGLTNVTGQFTIRFRAKADGYNIIALWFDNASVGARFNVSNGTVVSSAGVVAGTIPTITPDVDGYFVCSVTVSVVNGAFTLYILDNANNVSFAGDGTSGVLVDWIDVRPANLPAGLPPYQRIAAATDYDTVGFPVYLDTDGTDDNYVTGSIDFSGTDKMTIWAGMRKLNDTARIFCELSANVNTNNGAFAVVTGNDVSSFYQSSSRGNATSVALQAAKFTTGLYPAPDSAVITATHDIAGDLSRIRRNGSSNGAIDGTGDKGARNFGNYPLYLFSRNGNSLRWRGHFYGLIIRGAATETTQLEQTEQWLNQRMGGIY